MSVVSNAALTKTIDAAWEARDSVSLTTRGEVRDAVERALELLDEGKVRVAEKVTFYLRNQTPLLWLVDADERTIDVYRPGLPSTRHGAGDVITGEPVLPDFRLDVGALFAVLED